MGFGRWCWGFGVLFGWVGFVLVGMTGDAGLKLKLDFWMDSAAYHLWYVLL